MTTKTDFQRPAECDSTTLCDAAGQCVGRYGTQATCAAPQPAQPAAQAVALQGGLSNDELQQAWREKLPGAEPKGQELAAFAVGIEYGDKRARDLERQDWDRVHHALAKHGAHPGRTDEHLADVIDRALAAATAVAPPAVQPLTAEQVGQIIVDAGYDMGTANERATFIDGIRHAERAHRIGTLGGIGDSKGGADA